MIKQNKQNSKIINWSRYNESLKQRGSLDIWAEVGIEKSWYSNVRGTKGAQEKYSDQAIEMILTLAKVYHQKLRQIEGMVGSIFRILEIDVEVPDYTTLSRRGECIEVNTRIRDKEKITMIVDSTGFKVFGEGEWKVRKHGYSKHRTWKKLHIGIDKDGEIRTMILTGNDITDADAGVDLLEEETSQIERFVGDGGYDRRKVYGKCVEKKVKEIVIPPQKNAKIFEHGNKLGSKHPRDENLRSIRNSTRKQWKIGSGYHVRSLVESTMFRFKSVFTDRLNAHKDETQCTEAKVMCRALNIMRDLGMPEYGLKPS